MIIDCQDCEMYKSKACEDCFVMAILQKREGPLEFEAEEQEAISSLGEAGLAPVLKFKRKAG